MSAWTVSCLQDAAMYVYGGREMKQVCKCCLGEIDPDTDSFETFLALGLCEDCMEGDDWEAYDALHCLDDLFPKKGE